MRHKIFVYGTLKKGFYNNKYLATPKFTAPATTTRKFSLCIGGPYRGPYMFKDDKGHLIPGEIYRVTNKTLKKLDKLEGVHSKRYIRRKIRAKRKGRKSETCWAWINPKKCRCRRYKSYTRKLHKRFLTPRKKPRKSSS